MTALAVQLARFDEPRKSSQRTEGSGLPRAGLRLRDQVGALFDQERNRERLNFRRLFDAECLDSADQVCRHAKFSEVSLRLITPLLS